MKRVLVVDDEPVIINILVRFLEINGFEPVASLGGENVFEILSSAQKVDLVLLDMRMPKIKGTEILRKMKEMNINIPAIVLTGSINKEDHVKEFEELNLSMDDVCQKPVDLYMLLEKIKNKLL